MAVKKRTTSTTAKKKTATTKSASPAANAKPSSKAPVKIGFTPRAVWPD